MVAEKISRVRKITEELGQVKEKKFLEDVTEYYRDCFTAFQRENFEKALTLQKEEKRIQKKYEKSKNKELKEILKISRNISMLVR